MNQRKRRPWMSAGLLTLGCGLAADPAPAQRPESTSSSLSTQPNLSSAPVGDSTRAQLAALAVHHDDFARAELYTWTSVEQLRRVRESKALLIADPTTGGRASPFNRALATVERDGDPSAEIARVLLEHPDLNRRRYAWPSPFATTMGLGARRYGDSLIRIELDARAWIGRFEPGADEPLSFVDMSGQMIALDEVLAEPERVAALYHLRGPPELPIAYREYVVCSEAMIRAWSLATPEIRARVEAEVELLDQLRRHDLAQLPREAIHEAAAPSWPSAAHDSPPTPLALWHASLAFDNARYRPSAANLEAIAEALRGYEDDGAPPLTHRPSANAAWGGLHGGGPR